VTAEGLQGVQGVQILGAEDVRPLTDAEYGLFARLVHTQSGIHLGGIKRALVASRLLRRLRELSLSTYGAYYRRVVENADELRRMLDAITTNETQFFREPPHFELLSRAVVPAWREQAARGERGRDVRIWSAACSTGEEPYSVAMLLMSLLPAAEGWRIEILATDLSTRVLDHARRGIYREERAAHIPRHLLHSFMLRGTRHQAGHVKVGPALESAVTFARLNLIDAEYAVRGPFDAILCRNVFIYFDEATRRHVTARLLERLVPGGLLFIGHSESLSSVPGITTVIPTVYRRNGKDAAR
jgi:chemotaxis protein methyltransferase CheR